MALNCINPACRVPFSHARDGRFFSVNHLLTDGCSNATAQRHAETSTEQFWLCGACSQVLKVVVENGVIVTLPVDVESAALVG